MRPCIRTNSSFYLWAVFPFCHYSMFYANCIKISSQHKTFQHSRYGCRLLCYQQTCVQRAQRGRSQHCITTTRYKDLKFYSHVTDMWYISLTWIIKLETIESLPMCTPCTSCRWLHHRNYQVANTVDQGPVWTVRWTTSHTIYVVHIPRCRILYYARF